MIFVFLNGLHFKWLYKYPHNILDFTSWSVKLSGSFRKSNPRLSKGLGGILSPKRVPFQTDPASSGRCIPFSPREGDSNPVH